MNQSKSTHAVWLVLASLLFGAVVVWGYLDQNHYFSHIQVTKITSRAWENHQAKECASWNARSDKPILECDRATANSNKMFRCDFMAIRGVTWTPTR